MGQVIKEQYCTQTIQGKPSNPCKNNNICGFVAICMVLCYSQAPRRKIYWLSVTKACNNCLAEAKSRNCCDHIMSCIHTNDNTNLGSDDKMAKFRFLIIVYNETCLILCVIFPLKEQQRSIDKSMISYYGRQRSK